MAYSSAEGGVGVPNIWPGMQGAAVLEGEGFNTYASRNAVLVMPKRQVRSQRGRRTVGVTGWKAQSVAESCGKLILRKPRTWVIGQVEWDEEGRW